uniref:Selenoprotein O n=1 Tax=Macrostomum lignano TaxID=282301 RepID=A0A1I8I9R6_9PLAT
SRAGHPPPPAAAFSFPRLRGGFEQRRQRQLLSRVLSAEAPAFGFESLPPGVQPCPRQSVLITWPCPRGGRLTPQGVRVALVANFVLQINRAFGHRVDDLVASVPAGKVDGSNPSGLNWDDAGDCRKSRLMADVDRLGLRQCRVESEDCYARESHRLAQPAPPGRQRVLVQQAALATCWQPARAERSGCGRLHWVAGSDEAERFADLAAGLSHLGYRELANPSPWPMHTRRAGCYGNRNASGLEDLLSEFCSESRDNLLLQLLAESRSLAVQLRSSAAGGGALTAAMLRQARDRLMEFESAAGTQPGSWEPSNESALASYLAEFPTAAGLAYLTYEPAPPGGLPVRARSADPWRLA